MNPLKNMALAVVCLGLTGVSAVFAETGETLQYSYGAGAMEISGSVTIHEGETDDEIGAAIAEDIGEQVPVRGKSATHTFEYAGTWSRDEKSQEFVPDFTPVPRTFAITYNLPEGAVAEDLPASYTYGESVVLPKASLSGWKFVNWMGSLALVDRIIPGEFDDKTFTAVFSRPVTVFTGVDSIEVEIWQTDSDSAIGAKIDKYIARYETEVAPIGKPMAEDSTYTVSRWVAGANGIYTPEFDVKKKLPEKVQIFIAFNDPEGKNVKDSLIILSTDEDSVVTRKIAELLDDEGIRPPEKASDETYNYRLSSWKQNSATGLYEPIFAPFVKSKMVKAIYGSTRKEFVWLEVLMTDTEEEIIAKVDETIKESFTEPDKDADDLYLYEMSGWLYIGNDTYVPKFRAIAKPMSARVVYDVEKGSYVTIVIRATDTGSDIEKSIAKAFGEKPLPTKASTDKYDYEFRGWNKDLVEGVFVFTPDFDSVEVVKKNDAVHAEGTLVKAQFLQNGRVLEITGVQSDRVQVFDMYGRKIMESAASGASCRVEFPRAGMYVVKAGGEVRRFAIR